MNNSAPLNSDWPVTPNNAATIPTPWSNWFQQVFLAIAGVVKTFNITITLDFANTAAGGQSSLTATVDGARSGDLVMVTPTADVSGMIFTGVVTARDTVTVYAKNFSTGAVDPASQIYRILVVQN